MDVIVIFQIIVSVILIVLILLQRGGGGVDDLFGGGGGGAYKTLRGADKTIFRLTIVFGALFIALGALNLIL